MHTLHSQKPLAIQNHSPPPLPPIFFPIFIPLLYPFSFFLSPPSLFTKQILDWPCDYKDNKIVSTTYTKTTDFKKLKTKTKQQFNVHFCLRSQEQTYTPVYASTHIVIFTWSSPDLHLSHATHMHANFLFVYFFYWHFSPDWNVFFCCCCFFSFYLYLFLVRFVLAFTSFTIFTILVYQREREGLTDWLIDWLNFSTQG